MSGKGAAPTGGEQGGLLESVKQAGASVVNTVQQKAGGSQVRSNLPISAVCQDYAVCLRHEVASGRRRCARERLGRREEGCKRVITLATHALLQQNEASTQRVTISGDLLQQPCSQLTVQYLAKASAADKLVLGRLQIQLAKQ